MPRDGAIIFSDLTGTKKPPPTAKGGDPVQALGRPPYCGSSTGKPFGYGDASRWRCIVFPRRVHFGPTGD
ncbi:MAG: hypothetical protein WCB61_04005, partial [Pseudolabrys sp.]